MFPGLLKNPKIALNGNSMFKYKKDIRNSRFF